mmetsp:Transcript_6783/g.23850  ORF Transcript_6783/g.23850 Transcript_6783/m.23850 type:complete len:341 (+) Transcript_6783:109-1131(+)
MISHALRVRQHLLELHYYSWVRQDLSHLCRVQEGRIQVRSPHVDTALLLLLFLLVLFLVLLYLRIDAYSSALPSPWLRSPVRSLWSTFLSSCCFARDAYSSHPSSPCSVFKGFPSIRRWSTGVNLRSEEGMPPLTILLSLASNLLSLFSSPNSCGSAASEFELTFKSSRFASFPSSAGSLEIRLLDRSRSRRLLALPRLTGTTSSLFLLAFTSLSLLSSSKASGRVVSPLLLQSSTCRKRKRPSSRGSDKSLLPGKFNLCRLVLSFSILDGKLVIPHRSMCNTRRFGISRALSGNEVRVFSVRLKIPVFAAFSSLCCFDDLFPMLRAELMQSRGSHHPTL